MERIRERKMIEWMDEGEIERTIKGNIWNEE